MTPSVRHAEPQCVLGQVVAELLAVVGQVADLADGRYDEERGHDDGGADEPDVRVELEVRLVVPVERGEGEEPLDAADYEVGLEADGHDAVPDAGQVVGLDAGAGAAGRRGR